MTVELRLLRYFVAVAEELNFTRAAARLYIAQPSLSAAIRQLERQLGLQLFERDTRHVTLTAAAEALLPHAREALRAVKRGVRAAQAADAAVPFVLRVLYTVPLEPVALEALDRLEAAAPALRPTARATWSSALLDDLTADRADAGLLRFPGEARGLRLDPVGGDPPAALVGSNSPLAASDTLTLADLAGQRVAVWAAELGLDDYNAYVAALFKAAGVEWAPAALRRLDVRSWASVVAGDAISVIGSTERAVEGTRKVPLVGAEPMPIWVASVPSAPSQAIQALIDAVQAAIEALVPAPAQRH